MTNYEKAVIKAFIAEREKLSRQLDMDGHYQPEVIAELMEYSYIEYMAIRDSLI